MELTLQKKHIRLLPNSKIKLDVISRESAVVTEGNELDRVRYMIPCQADKIGDVYLRESEMFEMLKSETVSIGNTTRDIIVSDDTGLSFKQKICTTEDVIFPEYSKIGIKTSIGALRKAFKGVCATFCGCLLRYDGSSCEMVTTDRSQITRTIIPVTGAKQLAFSLVMSETSVRNISAFMERLENSAEMEVINTESYLILKHEDWEYATLCLEVVFPDCHSLIGSLKKVSAFTIGVDTFLHALECSQLMSDYVRFESADAGTYLFSEGENGSFGPFLISKDQIHLKKISCSAKKLGKGIKRFAEITGQKLVTIHLQNDDKSPLFIEDEAHLFVLAPMIG